MIALKSKPSPSPQTKVASNLFYLNPFTLAFILIQNN
jgi:hypothetical protein